MESNSEKKIIFALMLSEAVNMLDLGVYRSVLRPAVFRKQPVFISDPVSKIVCPDTFQILQKLLIVNKFVNIRLIVSINGFNTKSFLCL